MKHLVLCIFAFIYIGCGTDSGNPGLVPTSGINSTDFIGPAICAKIQSCFGSTVSNCETKIGSAANFTSAMGSTASSYSTLNDVLSALDDGNLSYNDSSISNCNLAVSSLSCSDPLVTQGYSPSSPYDLSQAYKFLSASLSCSSMVH